MSRKDNVSDRYITTALHDDVDATLARMLDDSKLAGGSVNPQFCGECGQRCGLAYPHPTDKTMVYCREHYEKLVAPVCEGCLRAIVGEINMPSNGKKYHPECYSEDHKCSRCSMPVIGQSTMALRKHWHPKCFTCTLCNTKLGDTYVDRSGSPYCTKCNLDLADGQKSRALLEGHGHIVASTNKEAAERNQVKTDLFDNVQKGKETCNWCRKIIVPGPFQTVTFAGALYHEQCFMCTTCGKSIGAEPFVNKNCVAHCQDCGKKSSVDCHGCRKPITSTYTIAGNNKYHPNCLVCKQCTTTLEKGYVENAGQFYCGPCSKGKTTVTTSQTTNLPAGRKGGFTVDPRSGKKTFH
ncbi:hypothetical protein SAMD00019534_119890, partial [Acytostelium subglobosum LB1]|uniref:hypothetical protein n=1 Tax=Acytostelium subglobosum LB1 TaxID=1410327 RepID=UPI0006450402